MTPNLHLLADPDDDLPPPPTPADLASSQWLAAEEWLADVRAGAGVTWYLRTLHDLTGRLLPTWSIFLGGYSKTYKTTLLQTQARWWAEIGIPVCYIGTETSTAMLRLQSAAIALELDTGAVAGAHLNPADTERVSNDLRHQATDLATRLMYADTDEASLADVLSWVHWGADCGAQVVIFDHIHQLSLGTRDQYAELTAAIRAIARAAKNRNIILLVAAQFREARSNDLANHEVPGDAQWHGSSAFHQVGAVCLQLWCPFRAGIGEDDKRAVRHGDRPVSELLRADTIGVRCSVHRYRKAAGEIRHLSTLNQRISDLPTRDNPDWTQR
jgi:hypothetical protein